MFGLGQLGDGETIKQIPPLNMLVLCGIVPPIVFIIYCNSHTSDGGKKDATYIIDQLQRKVIAIDQDQKLMDCFFFDGASNVQTADQIL